MCIPRPLILVLVVAAFAHGPTAAGGPARSPAAAPAGLPVAGETPLLPGRYATTRFRPAFSFTVAGDSWRVEHDRERDLLLMSGSACCGMNAGDRTGVLAFLRPSAVYSPGGSLRGVPGDLAHWLLRNPHLRSSPPRRIAIGGASGTEVDVAFGSATVLGGCASLFRVSFGVVRLCRGDRARIVVLRTNGKQLLVMSQALPAAGTAAVRAAAGGLLRSARFGRVRPRPAARTLVLGNSNPTNDDELFFAREAARRSGGALQVSLRSGLYGETATNEQLVVRDLTAGRLALAWDTSRVWDTLGVTTFQALQAPFLIDNDALLDGVITGPLAGDLLSGSRKKGIVGLGLAAESLRRPLEAKKRFVALDDFRDARINVITSELSAAAMRALGARPVSVGAGRLLRDALAFGRVDAAETAIDGVYSNGYAGVAKYMTENVVFFPKVISIDANQSAMAALTPGQQAALRDAAQATAARSTTTAAARDKADAAALCKAGIRFVRATEAQLATLVAAERPVYETLAKDAPTARLIDEIRSLKQRTARGPALALPAGCSG
jgi:C4-dicarboxylate-binding protein DctP